MGKEDPPQNTHNPQGTSNVTRSPSRRIAVQRRALVVGFKHSGDPILIPTIRSMRRWCWRGVRAAEGFFRGL